MRVWQVEVRVVFRLVYRLDRGRLDTSHPLAESSNESILVPGCPFLLVSFRDRSLELPRSQDKQTLIGLFTCLPTILEARRLIASQDLTEKRFYFRMLDTRALSPIIIAPLLALSIHCRTMLCQLHDIRKASTQNDARTHAHTRRSHTETPM